MLLDFHCLHHDRVELTHIRLTRWIESNQDWRVVGNLGGRPTIVAWAADTMAMSQLLGDGKLDCFVSKINWVEVGLPSPEWVRFEMCPTEVIRLLDWMTQHDKGWQLLDVDYDDLVYDLNKGTSDATE